MLNIKLGLCLLPNHIQFQLHESMWQISLVTYPSHYRAKPQFSVEKTTLKHTLPTPFNISLMYHSNQRSQTNNL